ncbi:MAG: hypothetical protein ACPG5D_00350 [Schleiferiaceae bacterium]
MTAFLISCSPSGETLDNNESDCSLDAPYSFNFEQAQYYSLPEIEFRFKLDYEWQIKLPVFAQQNFYYYQAARMNKAETNSILLKVLPLRRKGAYTTVSEHCQAIVQTNLSLAKRDSWVTESKDTVDGWWVNYGRYEQEPWDFIIAHKLITRDTSENSLVLELQMQCEANTFSLRHEPCLEEIINSFQIYL